MMKQFFKMKNIIPTLSFVFLQTLLQAQSHPPPPTQDDQTVLPIDQYAILLIILLVGVAAVYTYKHITRKKVVN